MTNAQQYAENCIPELPVGYESMGEGEVAAALLETFPLDEDDDLTESQARYALERRVLELRWAAFDYETYWATVLGPSRDAADVVREFDLVPSDRRSLSEWLTESESFAACRGATGHPGDAWHRHHERALDELEAALSC